jgi:hypothetical protein
MSSLQSIRIIHDIELGKSRKGKEENTSNEEGKIQESVIQKKELQKTMRKILSNDNFMKFQWPWIV